jgi:hypothetical protein
MDQIGLSHQHVFVLLVAHNLNDIHVRVYSRQDRFEPSISYYLIILEQM